MCIRDRGINDTWRRYDSSDPTDAETYYANVKKVISDVKKLGAEMLVLEPFLTKDDPDKYCYYEDLMPKILMLRKACREEGVDVYKRQAAAMNQALSASAKKSDVKRKREWRI